MTPPASDADSNHPVDQYSFPQSIGRRVVPTQEIAPPMVYDDRYFDLGPSGTYMPESHGGGQLNQTFDATSTTYRPMMGSLEPLTRDFFATYT